MKSKYNSLRRIYLTNDDLVAPDGNHKDMIYQLRCYIAESGYPWGVLIALLLINSLEKWNYERTVWFVIESILQSFFRCSLYFRYPRSNI